MKFSFFIILMFSQSAWAKGGGKAQGLQFAASLGYPQVSIENPDSTTAYYSGISVFGKAILPVYQQGIFSTSLTAGGRYLDLKNTASGGNTEVSNIIGPGVGIDFRVGNITLGYEYLVLRSRHYFVGDVSNKIEYDFSASNLHGGIELPLGALSVGLSYSVASGSISKSETELSRNSAYGDSVVWLTFKYYTGAGFGGFISSLLKGK